jgi:cell volume regulation protein A
MAFDYLLVGVAVLLLVSILASKASSRLGIPALLLFLLVGMLAGSDGPGGIYFDNYQLTQSLGVVALIFILFAGGLDTDWKGVRPVLGAGLSLATLGVVLSALLIGVFAMLALNFSLLEGLLLGAIVSSTDAAAVFAVLRGRGANLQEPITPLIELESGSNDPMAVFLTTSIVQLLVVPDASIVGLLPQFFLQMTLGVLCGLVFGRVMMLIINKSRLEYEGLYPVLSVALVVFIYSVTAVLGGNGFLAVYLAGLVLGNSNFVHRRSLLSFHDGIAWLLQITMFLVLGLLVFPSQLIPVMGTALLIALFLLFVARPISVLVSLAFSRLSLRARLMIAWVGLRGAVPIILATFPLLANVPRADIIFNVIFFVVLTSTVVQGTTLPTVARFLRVAAQTPSPSLYPETFVPAINLNSQVTELSIPASSPSIGSSILELNLPAGALVVLIGRGDKTIVPNGGTVLHAYDKLVVVATTTALADVYKRIGIVPPPEQITQLESQGAAHEAEHSPHG